jgi:hypothetical protein
MNQVVCASCGRILSEHNGDLICGRPAWYDRKVRPVCVRCASRLLGSDRQVAVTEIGKYHVSTVHLVLDNSRQADGPPICFETMVFTGDEDDPHNTECWRYPTEAAALAGHDQAVTMLREEVST